ncbi:base excision DNA repair -GPD family domain containing protein [Babesia ovata]|uniref:Endonuclease III homolog n=1 Tax=Babesia ovata TaxID=189622 RepID=A0A2H6KE37_9APIC|nr:base excision DNA repair -GPD family domain containing protein [Babesia ovata]GBE61255.1 base excision DNA repair -GPD family domain containing protein [Babesia ovata]
MAATWRRPWFKLLALALCSLKSLIRGVKNLRFTFNKSHCWITPAGLRIRVSQTATVVEQPANTPHLTELSEFTAAPRHDSVKQLIENIASPQFDLESLIKVMAREKQPRAQALETPGDSEASTATQSPARVKKVKQVVAKKPKVEYDNDYIELQYDTKRQPFRHVEENECSIPNFANVWNAIVDMRKDENAPVDTMGAHCCADESADKATYEYQTLIACMLSSQTKDAVTAAAMDALKERGLNVESVAKMPEEELDSLISKVGFHKTKAKHIKQATDIIIEKYNGRVPDTIQELVSLPGVGPKMANLVMQLAFKRINGIAVDLHVHRIANRLGWVKTKTPEETRIKLQSLLPQKLWAEINHLLVGFGQTICVAAGPGCATCAANTWCPTGRANLAK